MCDRMRDALKYLCAENAPKVINEGSIWSKVCYTLYRVMHSIIM